MSGFTVHLLFRRGRAAQPPSRTSAVLRPYVKPYRARFAWGVAAALAASLLGLAVPQILRLLVDGPIASGDRRMVVLAGAGVMLLGVVEASLWWSRRALTMTPALGVESGMRRDLYADLQQLPVSFHDDWDSGQLLSRSSTDLSMVRRWFAFGRTLLIVNVVIVVAGVAALAVMSPVLGVLFLVLSVPVLPVSFRFQRSYSVASRASRDQAGTLATLVEQSVHGIRVLKAFGRGRYALGRFREQAERLREIELGKARTESWAWMWLIAVPQVAFATCLGVGLPMCADGRMTVGEVTAFFATAAYLSWPIESLGFLFAELVDARTAVDRVAEVLEAPRVILDPEPAVVPDRTDGELVFERVHFRYPDASRDEPDLLAGVDLTVHPGETLALVGVTGSGKSALVELVPRLFDVTAGRILLDGLDIRRMPLRELRRRVAVAFEEPTLFSASVRENVLLGAPAASDEVLGEALEVAQADFVYRLPRGVDTVIGEEGHSLSGGQRQRIALARAVAAAPELLVLDDPLSALDVDTEARVEEALRSVLARTTALVVAHRPSTVAMADRVALLADGRVVAVGRHSELLASLPAYRHVVYGADGRRG